jgi:hypothetical protein
MVSYFSYTETLKMEAICFADTPAPLKAIGRTEPEHGTLRNRYKENLESIKTRFRTYENYTVQFHIHTHWGPSSLLANGQVSPFPDKTARKMKLTVYP